MTKYTINKVFQRKFHTIIWKIEIDNYQRYLALETRNLDTTNAFISVLDFDGAPILLDHPLDERDWSLHSIQSDFLIFKKIGENTPTKEGVLVIDFINNREIFRSYEYSLIDVYNDIIKVKHRMFASGMEEYLAVATGQKIILKDAKSLLYPTNSIIYPIAYTFPKPPFLESLAYEGDLYLSKSADYYLWSYHKKNNQVYELNLCISDLNQIFINHVILSDLEKLIPQPYFQVGNQLFLMSYNKQEIVSYLV